MIADDFNNDLPIPPVTVADMKQMWAGMRRMSADTPPRPDTATSLGVYASYGIDAASRGVEEFVPVALRHALLDALLKRGVLNDYMQANDPSEKLFLAAAMIPCNRQDLWEAFAKLKLSQMPTEAAAKAKQDMSAEGHNPDTFEIDRKFLDWIRENC